MSERDDAIRLAIDEDADAIMFCQGESRLVWWSEHSDFLAKLMGIPVDLVMPLGDNAYIDRTVIDTLSTEPSDGTS